MHWSDWSCKVNPCSGLWYCENQSTLRVNNDPSLHLKPPTLEKPGSGLCCHGIEATFFSRLSLVYYYAVQHIPYNFVRPRFGLSRLQALQRSRNSLIEFNAVPYITYNFVRSRPLTFKVAGPIE